jgi:protein required for attachment to host cells
MTGRTTWILVCDASRARLFSDTSPNRSYALLATFEHPEARQHVSDLVADAQGRKPVGGSRGAGVNGRPGGFFGRPGTEQENSPKEVEALKFARDLAAALERGLDDHAYDAVVVAAPPRFLGRLLETISEQVRRRLARTIDKDLSLLPPRDVEKRLRAQQAA